MYRAYIKAMNIYGKFIVGLSIYFDDYIKIRDLKTKIIIIMGIKILMTGEANSNK